MKYQKNELINIFEKQGVFLEYTNLDEKLSLDSITFVMLIIEIENFYGIEIPDDYLIIDELNTFNKFARMLENL